MLLLVACAVLLVPAGAFAVADNSGCLACHSDDQVMSVDPVDRDVVCKSCHLDFAGAHPYHQSGANCGAACHRGWGAASPSATPIVTDAVAGASFATTGSIDVPASVLHTIHSTASWPASVSGGPLTDACASCHAVASCKACHTGVIPATHGNHSATGNALFAAQSPWTGTMGRGVLLADQTMKTAVLGPNQCAAAGCHDLVATQAGKPRITEDYNYALGGNATDPTGTNSAISTVGTWRTRFATSYSGGRMSYSNSAVTSLTATVSGDRFEV
ncbi:hypothetical protein EG835_03610, partial [bacterium]|nr:hypothetical protein [bacterium]